jgi:hypothetical protein
MPGRILRQALLTERSRAAADRKLECPPCRTIIVMTLTLGIRCHLRTCTDSTSVRLVDEGIRLRGLLGDNPNRVFEDSRSQRTMPCC